MENLNYENEIWRDIPEYEGLYQASNLGRVKSLPRQNINHNLKNEKILKLHKDKDGYLFIQLHKNKTIKKYFVHRLVWLVFSGPIPENMQINHINEVKTDNRLSNLNLMTCKENINWGTGIQRGHNTLKNSNRCKPVLQYDMNGKLIKEWVSAHQVERELGFKQSAIYACCSGKELINKMGYKWIPKSAYGYKWAYKE